MFFVFVESFSVIFPLAFSCQFKQTTYKVPDMGIIRVYCTLDSTRAACVVCSSHCY